MGIEEFVANREIVEKQLKSRDLSENAYNLYLKTAQQAEQIKTTGINKPGYTPEDMTLFLIEVYNGLKLCAIQQRNTELIKEYNSKIEALGG